MAMDDQNTLNQFSPMGLQMQQAEIARQRAISQYLQEQSLQSPQGQMVSGHYVAPNPTQYVSKLAQGLIGKNMQSDLDAKQMGLVNQYNVNMLKVAQALQGGDQSDSAPPAFGQNSSSPAMPSNPAVTNSPVNLPTEDGDVQTFKQPLYPITSDTSTSSDSGMVSNAQPRRGGGNTMFRNVGLPAIAAYLQDPNSAMGKLVGMQVQGNLKGMEPTELIKTMRAAGIDENSPRGRQILQDNITKTNYIAPINAREGSTILDPRTNQPIFNAPNKDGFYYTFGAGGVPTAHQISGAADAIGAAEDANAGAKANYQVQTGVDANNNPIFTTTGAIARNANGTGGNSGGRQPTFPTVSPQQQAQANNDRITVLQQELANEKDPSNRAALQREIASTQAANAAGKPFSANTQQVRPAAPPGYADGQTVMATANAKGYQDLKTQAAGAADRMNALDNILDLANGGTKYGPGTAARITKLSSLNSFLPPGMAFGNDDIANAQVMQKWVSNLAGQYMKALGGTGTDAQLENALKSIANPEMQNQAIKEVVPKLKALEAAVQAKANAYDNWLAQPGNSVDKGNVFENQFRNAYDPRVFQLNMMPPDQQKAFVGKLSPADAKALLAKRQQLRAMGAF